MTIAAADQESSALQQRNQLLKSWCIELRRFCKRPCPVGRKLLLALDLSRSAPGTMGHTAAWTHAEDAVELLGEALSSGIYLGDTLTTAKRRALTTPTQLTEGEIRRIARLRRG